MSSLPTELVLLILEDLSDNTLALKSCALVSRTWYTPSRRYFFHTILIDTDIVCRRWHDLLVNSPHIIEHIHDLYIVTDDIPDAILEAEDALASSLLLLTHVERLSMRMGWRMRWHDLSMDLRDSIIHILKLPTLTHLVMENWYFDLGDIDLHNLLMHGTSMKHLELLNPSSPTGEEPSEDQFLVQVAQRARLEELSVGLECAAFGFGEWFCRSRCSLDLSGLRSLSIMDTADTALINRMLKLAPPLREFYLQVHTFWLSPEYVDLSNNLELRILQLDFNSEPLTGEQCPPPWLDATLNSIPLSSCIDEVHLNFFLGFDSYYPDTIFGWDYSGWKRLTSLLMSSKFRSLRLVNVTVDYYMMDPVPFKVMAMREMRDLGSKLRFQMVER